MLRKIARPRLAALFTALTLGAFVAVGAISDADARAGRGGNIGSRGARTYQAPAPTTTAPRTNPTMDRTVTQAPRQQAPAAGGLQQRPSFGGGMLGGFAAGLLGAGLVGMLFGGGFFSGLAGLAGFLGLILQIALIAGIVMLVLRLVRGRREQRLATAGGPEFERRAQAATGGGYGGGLGAAAAARMPQQPIQRDTVGIGPQDYQDFERLLGEVQTAYGRGDVGTLRLRTSPEMASYFEGELADLRDRGLTPRISDVRLLQGDLSEAWREGEIEYATVAMRYSLVDQTLDRSGRVVDGQPTPIEATELWTFVRGPMTSGRWYLSAIQQAG